MTPQQMKEKSEAKVKQVSDLMELLQLSAEAKQKVNRHGIIENLVMFIDRENYPTDPTAKASGIGAGLGAAAGAAKPEDAAMNTLPPEPEQNHV